jgi:hypothetical protein
MNICSSSIIRDINQKKDALVDRTILAAIVMLSAISATASATDAATAPSAISLDYFVGRWRCEGVFPASGKPIASTLKFEQDTASGALLKHHDDTPPNIYHALELWGFVKAGGLSDTIMASNGGVYPPFTSPGWSGDTLMWSSPPGVSPAQRFTYVRLSPDRMRMDWSVAKIEGEYQIGDTLTCVRS